MKILMFGRGVIATQYAWALEKAGNMVDFYVRPGRAIQYGSSVNLEILDARKNKKGTLVKGKWPIAMREELEANHDYDLIIVSVNHNQLDEVIRFIAPRVGKATVMMFNNLWVDPKEVESLLPKDQLVWGFPGAGGGYTSFDTLKGGFMKSIFMGFVGDTTATLRYKNVRTLFEKANFSISEKKDFRSWLWFHFAFNAGLSTQALKVGGFDKVFDSTDNLKQVILLVREMLPLIREKGGKTSLGTILLMHLPAGLPGFVLKKVMEKGNLARNIMEPMSDDAHLYHDATCSFPRDVLTDGRRLGVPLPGLEASKVLFQGKNQFSLESYQRDVK